MVLGSTGSIGESTLAVVRAMPGEFRIVAMCCARRWERLAAQAAEFGPEAVAIFQESAAARFEGECAAECRLYRGAGGILSMIEEVDAEIVVNGVSGAPGLLPSLAALRSGKDLALANKESMVMAGRIVLAEASAQGRNVIPVDSEHAALFSLLGSQDYTEVAELILTASGGAFRDLSVADLARVRFADALRHPTWKMGAKITVDSASMANKGLEVIEAHRLFGIDTKRIQVLVHPESLVHSLVRTIDGTLHAQISTPDMRIPIQNALTYPAVRPGAVDWLDLASRRLTFLPVDMCKFRMLSLAYGAAVRSAAHPIVFNAANEVAVASFMEDAVPFSAIAAVVEEALASGWTSSCDSIDEVLAVDAEARRRASDAMKGFTL
jgi:1-deoxy-D-xylulose-5-phosphate reductoisomerase